MTLLSRERGPLIVVKHCLEYLSFIYTKSPKTSLIFALSLQAWIFTLLFVSLRIRNCLQWHAEATVSLWSYLWPHLSIYIQHMASSPGRRVCCSHGQGYREKITPIWVSSRFLGNSCFPEASLGLTSISALLRCPQTYPTYSSPHTPRNIASHHLKKSFLYLIKLFPVVLESSCSGPPLLRWQA